MALSNDQISNLVREPHESLSIEIKDWIDPDSPEGITKIVRAAIAMRNNDGGFLLIGFKNETGLPNLENVPEDVIKSFHVDKIQGYVSKYASETFEVTLYYPEIEGKKFVVIESHSGVRSPVATKSCLEKAGKKFIQIDKVFIRSLNSNNTPSTTEANWKDWPQIIEKCFENREADVGRFLRRHLTNVASNDLRDLFHSIFENHNFSPKNNKDLLIKFLDDSHERYKTSVIEKNIIDMPSHGSMEVGFFINLEEKKFGLDQDFLNLIASSNPSYTGWPVWLDSRNFRNTRSIPFVNDGYWEALIVSLEKSWRDHIDYWRIHPEGKFYLYRALEDDIVFEDRGPEPFEALDFGLIILRVAECVAVALEFAKSMGCNENSDINFIFRWSELKGRRLCSWSNPNRHLSLERKAYQNQVVSELNLPVNTAKSAISGYVQRIVDELFSIFDGFKVSQNVTDDLVRKLIERKL